MNIYLLQLIGKWLNILLVAILSSTGFIDYTEETKDIILKNKDTSLTVESTVVKFETVTKYNDNLTTDIKNVLVEGQDGLVFVDEKGNIVKTRGRTSRSTASSTAMRPMPATGARARS